MNFNNSESTRSTFVLDTCKNSKVSSAGQFTVNRVVLIWNTSFVSSLDSPSIVLKVLSTNLKIWSLSVIKN